MKLDFDTLFLCLLIAAFGVIICAIIVLSANARDAPAGWTCTKDLAPSASCSIYLLTSPDGQVFLVNSKGGIIPYAPKTEAK